MFFHAPRHGGGRRGGLLIPTIAADMINAGIGGGDMEYLIRSGIRMTAVTIAASLGGILGSYLSADLSSKIGRDMRNALYDKSLEFSACDFEQFGTGSMITRTLNDVNVIQQGVVWFIQMVLPVPAVCIMGIVLSFSIDTAMGGPVDLRHCFYHPLSGFRHPQSFGDF